MLNELYSTLFARENAVIAVLGNLNRAGQVATLGQSCRQAGSELLSDSLLLAIRNGEVQEDWHPDGWLREIVICREFEELVLECLVIIRKDIVDDLDVCAGSRVRHCTSWLSVRKRSCG
jgi:hypothetical protein